MSSSPKQIAIGGLDSDVEKAVEIKAEYVWREELWGAIKAFALSYTAYGRRGYDACAAELTERWGPKGRSVSGALLRAAVEDVERNNLRAEWLYWFASQSQEVADLMGRHVKPVKTPEQERDDIIAEFREELSHKRVEAVLRRARAR